MASVSKHVLPCSFRVEGPVRPLARPRVVRRKGVVHAYTPRSSVTYKNTIAWAARNGIGRRPWPKDRTYAVVITVRRPASKRGDIDNIAKVVLDALKGTFYKDDGQVRRLEILLEEPHPVSSHETLDVFVCTMADR